MATSPVYATGRNHSDSYAVNSSLIVQQQGRTVTGIVIDDKGETIIGANVMVKGTTNGSITNIDGQFTLNNVPEGATLVISFVGYKEQAVKVGAQSNSTSRCKKTAN